MMRGKRPFKGFGARKRRPPKTLRLTNGELGTVVGGSEKGGLGRCKYHCQSQPEVPAKSQLQQSFAGGLRVIPTEAFELSPVARPVERIEHGRDSRQIQVLAADREIVALAH